jgi:hypothetical protein
MRPYSASTPVSFPPSTRRRGRSRARRARARPHRVLDRHPAFVVEPVVAETRTRAACASARRRAPRRTPRAGSACGSRASRRTRRCAVRERREEAREQIAVRHVQLDEVEAGGVARRVAATKASRTRVQVGASIARGAGASRRRRERRRAERLPRASPSPSGASPSHGCCTSALRPACASWMPIARRVRVHEIDDARHAASCSSFHRPVQPCVMRPSGETFGHLGDHEARAADGAAARGARGASRSARRHRRVLAHRARRRCGCAASGRAA